MDKYLNILISIYIILACILTTITVIYGISDNQFTCETSKYWWCNKYTSVDITIIDINYLAHYCIGSFAFNNFGYICEFYNMTDIYEYNVKDKISGYIEKSNNKICYTKNYVDDFINKNDKINHSNYVNLLAIFMIFGYFLSIILFVHIIIPFISTCFSYIKMKFINRIESDLELEQDYEMVPGSEFKV